MERNKGGLNGCSGGTGCTGCTGCAGCTKVRGCTGCTGCTGCEGAEGAQGAKVHRVRRVHRCVPGCCVRRGVGRQGAGCQECRLPSVPGTRTEWPRAIGSRNCVGGRAMSARILRCAIDRLRHSGVNPPRPTWRADCSAYCSCKAFGNLKISWRGSWRWNFRRQSIGSVNARRSGPISSFATSYPTRQHPGPGILLKVSAGITTPSSPASHG